MKEEKSDALKLVGIIMILFGIGYAILGTLSLLEVIVGPLPGHEHGEVVIIALSYITLIIALLGGIISIKGSLKNTLIVGIIFTIIGMISLIYTYLVEKIFNNFDCITVVLGIGIIILTILSKIENKKIKAIKKEKGTTTKINKHVEQKKKNNHERIRPVKRYSKIIKIHEKKPNTTQKKKSQNTKEKISNTKKKNNNKKEEKSN